VLVILSLVIQLMLDHAKLPAEWVWGLFPEFRTLLYTGAALLSLVTLATGIGLVR